MTRCFGHRTSVPVSVCRPTDHDLHPYTGLRRNHVEGYLRHPEQHDPPLANTTLRRRICTLTSWFSWLEDEEVSVGNPAGVRRPDATPAHTRGWTATRLAEVEVEQTDDGWG